MSSNMLEQAVIDAEALREAAMKNAEQEVLEKYSGEIKQAVNSLLEQDEDLFGMDDEGGEEEVPGIADQMPIAATDGENMCPCPEEEEPMVLDLDQIVAAAQAAESEEEMDLGGEVAADEEELFEVNDENLLETITKILNEEESDKDYDGDGKKESPEAEYKGSRDKAIKKSMSKEEEDEGKGTTQKGDFDKTNPKKAAYEKGNVGGKIVEDESRYHDREAEYDDRDHIDYLERDAHDDDVDKYKGNYHDYLRHKDAAKDDWAHIRDLAKDASKDYRARMGESDEEELDEELLDEIVEALVVDMKNVPSGDMFHTHPTMGQNERGLDIALAQEQDTEFAEEQKELRQALKKLQEQVKSQKLDLNKQKKDFDNLKSIALKATKKLEEVNFSNAKLIYTNRILKSDSLNERQKNKLVEAISKVGSVEEAKIVYDTLNENLSPQSRAAPRSLNEAVSKNNPLILKSNKNEKQTAGQNQVDRLRRLAGII